jgi:hypothetical protein
VYEFTGFFAKPAVPRPESLPPGAVWRDVAAPFAGVGVRLPASDDRLLLAPSDAEPFIRQLGLDAADCWVYLTYVCWGGKLDFVYGFGSCSGMLFGPIKEDDQDAVDAAYTGLMERFGVCAEGALNFDPFRRGYWGE